MTTKIGYKEESRFNYTGNGWEGKQYDSSLKIKEIAKHIKKHLKKKFPDAKWSVTSKNRVLSINLMKWNKEVFNPKAELTDWDKEHKQLGCNLSEYNKSELTEEAYQLFKYVQTLGNSFNYNDSDAQIDYFDSNFYLRMNIGRYNKNFER